MIGKTIEFVYFSKYAKGEILDKVIVSDRVRTMTNSQAAKSGRNPGDHGTFQLVEVEKYLVKIQSLDNPLIDLIYPRDIVNVY